MPTALSATCSCTPGQAGERQITNLNSLLTEYVKLAYHGMRAQDSNFNVTIQENLDPSIEPVKVVAHDLSRVFLNIANNACYAAYEKKRRLGDGFSPTVAASTRNRGDYIDIGSATTATASRTPYEKEFSSRFSQRSRRDPERVWDYR